MPLEVNNPAAKLTRAIAEQSATMLGSQASGGSRAAEGERLLDALDRRERAVLRTLKLLRSTLLVLACTAVLHWVLPTGMLGMGDRARDGGLFHAAAQRSSFSVGDGLVVMAPGARVRQWVESSHFVLEAGRVELLLHDSGIADWTWSAGVYRVTGEQADVELAWDPEMQAMDIVVRRGSARVEDPTRSVFHLLRDNDQLHLTPPSAHH